MPEEHTIQVRFNERPGYQSEGELDVCPFRTDEGEGAELLGLCRLTRKECNFGMPELQVPEHCPLRHGAIRIGRVT